MEQVKVVSVLQQPLGCCYHWLSNREERRGGRGEERWERRERRGGRGDEGGEGRGGERRGEEKREPGENSLPREAV